MNPTNYVHIHLPRMRENRTKGQRLPVVTVKRGRSGKSAYGHQAVIRCPHCGAEAARVVQHESSPLPCGARVTVQTQGSVETVDESDEAPRYRE